MSNHHLLIIFPWILDAFQWRGPSSKCAACGTVADVLHSHEFNFLQATNYLWLNVTRRRTDSFMPFLHFDKLLSWWTGGVAAGVCTTKTECSRGYDSCCTKCCLIIPEWTETWWRPQNFSTDCSTEAKEVRQSVVVARAKTEDVATAQQHWHIHHFSGPVARRRAKDQEPRISAGRRQQLLQQRRGNFLSHVTSLQGRHRTKGQGGRRTKGRRDVTKNAKQAQHSPLFAIFSKPSESFTSLMGVFKPQLV